jgi:hypothetical protein
VKVSCHSIGIATLAATNKSLAQSHKSRTVGDTTKSVKPFPRDKVRVVDSKRPWIISELR